MSSSEDVWKQLVMLYTYASRTDFLPNLDSLNDCSLVSCKYVQYFHQQRCSYRALAALPMLYCLRLQSFQPLVTRLNHQTRVQVTSWLSATHRPPHSQQQSMCNAAVSGRYKQDHQRDANEHGQLPLPLCVHHLCGSQAGETWHIV